MSETSNLSRVLLSWPTPLHLATTTDGARRSWIQLAKTGSFVSTRYGKFSITRDDLSSMLHNYTNITPAAPTELPVDYDHLSMDPKKPGDGIAAGWMKKLELREDGDELWAEIEWTPDGAERIQNQEYRFVSPSFVKDHTHKDGKKIGTTLLAAAITNHPFLEGMKALTLYNFSTMGDLALVTAPTSGTAVHLAELGQRVTFRPDAERTPELSDEERRQTFLVKSTIGAGEDQFVRLTKPDGTEFGWFRVSTQLAPARAAKANPIPPDRQQQEDTAMQDTKTDIEQQAAQFSARVARHFTHTRNWTKAFELAQSEDDGGALAYRLCGVNAEAVEQDTAPVLNLSTRSGESFDQLAQRYALEKGVSLREAVREVGRARPDLAAARG